MTIERTMAMQGRGPKKRGQRRPRFPSSKRQRCGAISPGQEMRRPPAADTMWEDLDFSSSRNKRKFLKVEPFFETLSVSSQIPEDLGRGIQYISSFAPPLYTSSDVCMSSHLNRPSDHKLFNGSVNEKEALTFTKKTLFCTTGHGNY